MSISFSLILLLITPLYMSTISLLHFTNAHSHECVYMHNSARSTVAIPVPWNDNVESYARSYASLQRPRDFIPVHKCGVPYVDTRFKSYDSEYCLGVETNHGTFVPENRYCNYNAYCGAPVVVYKQSKKYSHEVKTDLSVNAGDVYPTCSY